MSDINWVQLHSTSGEKLWVRVEFVASWYRGNGDGSTMKYTVIAFVHHAPPVMVRESPEEVAEKIAEVPGFSRKGR